MTIENRGMAEWLSLLHGAATRLRRLLIVSHARAGRKLPAMVLRKIAGG
jgi:hypothetical protein